MIDAGTAIDGLGRCLYCEAMGGMRTLSAFRIVRVETRRTAHAFSADHLRDHRPLRAAGLPCPVRYLFLHRW